MSPPGTVYSTLTPTHSPNDPHPPSTATHAPCDKRHDRTRAANPTKRMKEEWQREARAGYGLGADALAEVDAALEEAAAAVHQVGGGETARFARLPLISLLGARTPMLW